MATSPSDRAADAHQEKIREVMAEVYRRAGRNGEAVCETTPLDAMIATEEGMADDEKEIRVEAIRAWTEWIMQEGPDPHRVMKRLYTFLNYARPDLLLNMSGSELSAIFDQTRAAQAARVKMLINLPLQEAGFKATRASNQKSASSLPKYAAAARGNQNRCKGLRRKAASAA